jgi:hypothetical protein
MNCRVPKIVAVSLPIASANFATAQEDGARQPAPSPLTSCDRSDAWKIENALSAGPKFITDHATVVHWPSAQDNEHKMRVLREGSNGWSCMPEGDGLIDYGDRRHRTFSRATISARYLFLLGHPRHRSSYLRVLSNP